MSENKMTFEQSMVRLEEITSLLEKNELPLDETIELFEEGLKLVKQCDSQLQVFESRIKELITENGGEANEN